MFVQDEFLYLIVTRHKLTVHIAGYITQTISILQDTPTRPSAYRRIHHLRTRTISISQNTSPRLSAYRRIHRTDHQHIARYTTQTISILQDTPPRPSTYRRIHYCAADFSLLNLPKGKSLWLTSCILTEMLPVERVVAN
jgi:hypothetical protein